MDGVLADMESALVRHAEALFGEAMTRRLLEPPKAPPPATARATARAAVPGAEAQKTTPTPEEAEVESLSPLLKLNMTTRQQDKLWRHVESVDGFWETLREIEPGAVAHLAAIAHERRWEVIFLTKRPPSAGATSQIQSQRWLESKGFALPSVFVVQGSRGRIAAALDLDIVVDDRPENCLDVVVDSTARALLVWRDSEQLLPKSARRLGIGMVRSVAECLEILVQIDSQKPEPKGVVDRVLRLLKLKDPADH